MNKTCNCQDWTENMEIINAPYRLHLSTVGDYKGKKFEFCPWCGKRLVNDIDSHPTKSGEGEANNEKTFQDFKKYIENKE